MIGVYKITNLINSKFYIGSSVNIEQRWFKHKALLRHNKHENPKLQNAWNKYSEENFLFEVLEECEIDNVRDREQFYLNTLLFAKDFDAKINTKFDDLGYNLTTSAYGNYLTPESIKKISETLKFKYENNLVNKTHTKKCYQYNRYTGELIKTWDIVNDACRHYNTPSFTTDQIHRALWNTCLTAYDSYWSYYPVNFVWCNKSTNKSTICVQNLIDNTYTFLDSILFLSNNMEEIYGFKVGRRHLKTCIENDSIVKNSLKIYKVSAPIIYDGKPFELLGTREDLVTKTSEEILNVNVKNTKLCDN